MKILYVLVGLTIFLVAAPAITQAQSSQESLPGKEIMEKLSQLETRLIRVEEGQKALNEKVGDVGQENSYHSGCKAGQGIRE